jgi:hypothetical protein
LGNGPGIPEPEEGVAVVAVKVGCGSNLGSGSNLAGSGGAKKNGSC